MEHLKIYEDFKNPNKVLLIHTNCNFFKIKNYTINKDYSINVDGNVKLSDIKFSNFRTKKYGLMAYINKLKKLKKLPIKFNRVSGYFSCPDLSLDTFENFPKYIGDFLLCSSCKFTTFLECPIHIGNTFFCYNNNFKDFYGFPSSLEYPLYVENNPVCEILNLISKPDFEGRRNINEDKSIKFIKFLNEYEVIRNQNTIIESRLEDAIYEVDRNKKLPQNIEFKNYRII